MTWLIYYLFLVILANEGADASLAMSPPTVLLVEGDGASAEYGIDNKLNRTVNLSQKHPSCSCDHSFESIKADCQVSYLDSKDNPCFKLADLGCYCIVKENVINYLLI